MAIFNLFPLFVCCNKQRLISRFMKLGANTRSYTHNTQLSMQQEQTSKEFSKSPCYNRY